MVMELKLGRSAGVAAGATATNQGSGQMSRSIAFHFTAVTGTGAGLGQSASGHTLLADRPDGTAGGRGLGFNGGELLAASLGGCFWNDLYYAAHEVPGLRVGSVHATVDLAGDPPRVVRARISAKLLGADDKELARIFDAACNDSTIANSLRPAFPISFERLTD
jgi:organic hydroperoxide reductase OsmC/OhrA